MVTAEQCLHRVKAFCASHPTPPARGLRGHKELGGDTAGTADPADPRDQAFQTTGHHAQHIKLGEDKGCRGDIWSDGILSSQVTVMCDGALLSWRWLNTCLPMGSSE